MTDVLGSIVLGGSCPRNHWTTGLPRWIYSAKFKKSGLFQLGWAKKFHLTAINSFSLWAFLRCKDFICRKIFTIPYISANVLPNFVINAMLDRGSRSDVRKIRGMRDYRYFFVCIHSKCVCCGGDRSDFLTPALFQIKWLQLLMWGSLKMYTPKTWNQETELRVVRGVPRLDGAPVCEPKVFPEQMYFIEENTCDVVVSLGLFSTWSIVLSSSLLLNMEPLVILL